MKMIFVHAFVMFFLGTFLMGCAGEHTGADLNGLKCFSIIDGKTTVVELEHVFGPALEKWEIKSDGTQGLFWYDSRKETSLVHIKVSNRYFTVIAKNGIVIRHRGKLDVPIDI